MTLPLLPTALQNVVFVTEKRPKSRPEVQMKARTAQTRLVVNLFILDVEEQSGVSVHAYCCQTQKRGSGGQGPSGKEWHVKWTLDTARINCSKEEKCGKLRRHNKTGSEICYHKRAEQNLGRQANGRDATHRQQNHKIGDGCGDGQWHVQSCVYKIWKRIVQTFKADIQRRSTQ